MSKKSLLVGVILAGILVGLVFFANKSDRDTDVVVKIGYRNITASFATLVAKDLDLFKKKGLKVEFVTFVSGSESYNALVRGDIQYDPYLTLIPIFINDPKDPGLVKITGMTAFTEEEKFDQIVVKTDSPIKSIFDLVGKSIAVNPGSTASTFLKIALKNRGIDPEKVRYIQLQTKDQLTSLEAGSVDAMMSYEPTTSIALDTGRYRTVHGSIFAELFPGAPVAGRAVNGKFAKMYPSLVREIDGVFLGAQDYAKANPAYLHKLMVAENKLPLSVAQKINLSYMGPTDEKTLQKFIDYLISVGELKESVNASSLIFK